MRRHQARRRTSSGKGNIKGQVYIIERFHPAFYKPNQASYEAGLLTYQVYEDLVRRSPPELPQLRKSSNHDAAKKAKDIDEKKKTTCNSFLATQETQTVHSPGLYVQVHIRVWLPVVECAATWPIKKTKTKHLSQCILHTSCTSSTHLPHILCTPCTSCKYTNTKCLKYIYVTATTFFYIYAMATSFFYIYVNGY